ncbi:MAG: hypothetical protein V7707_14030 [Motiliproteus sp.]
MYLTWQQRLAEDTSLRDLANWPGIATYQCESSKYRRQFLRNQQIVARVLAGDKQSEVANAVGVSPSWISRLLSRCLGGEDSTPPRLTAGLIPYNHLASGQRRSPLSSVTKPRGARCSFSHLLTVAQGLKAYLDNEIKKDVGDDKRGQNLTPKTLHQAFINHLISIHWPRDTYPFTEEKRGAESLRRYYHLMRAQLTMPKDNYCPTQPRVQTDRIFSEIEIDSQTMDVFTQAAIIDTHGNLKPVRLSRVSLYLARDVASKCYLGYWIAFTKHPNQDDVLALLKQLVTPWSPMTLTTPGLTYPPGPCFPTALDETVCRLTLGIVKFDNAFVHSAGTVRDFVCNRLGATLNFGLPKQPKGRHVIEQAFARVNQITHRFKSTTGSHPRDPIKESQKLSKFPPLLSLKVLEEVVSVFLAEENARLLPQLEHHSPLDIVANQLANCYLLLRPRMPENALNPFIEERQIRVCKTKAEQRSPYVHFEYLRYSGRGLNHAHLIGQMILIRFDRRDIRSLHAYSSKGEDLGSLLAPRSWQRYAHSLKTRKAIFKLNQDASFDRSDPLLGYFSYLDEHKALPAYALELVRVNREYNAGVIELPETPATAELSVSHRRPATTKTDVPAWSSTMVCRRRR